MESRFQQQAKVLLCTESQGGRTEYDSDDSMHFHGVLKDWLQQLHLKFHQNQSIGVEVI